MKRLINTPFYSMHRVMDMLCLNFGTVYRKKTIAIGPKVIDTAVWPTYSLHLQTQWRFTHNGRILLGSRDIYEPFSANVDEDWDYTPNNRPDEKSSVFDVVSKAVSAALQGTQVTDCVVSPAGDIHIAFSNGYAFDVFIPASVQSEEWRLIDFSKDEHIIFYDV